MTEQLPKRHTGLFFQRRVYHTGTRIFTEGQEGHEAFVIESGAIELHKRSSDGTPVVIARLGQRALFGEMALVDNRPRSATAVATQDTVCLIIKEHEFKDRLKELSPWCQALVRILVDNLRETTSLRAGGKSPPTV